MALATPSVPDWLKLRDGALRPGVLPESWLVMIGGQPMYRLEIRPAAGAHTCSVVQTVNGKRLDDAKTTYPTGGAALAGGLDQLRNALGW